MIGLICFLLFYNNGCMGGNGNLFLLHALWNEKRSANES